jgi:predicted enzyme related to lactoylglutathione lyase
MAQSIPGTIGGIAGVIIWTGDFPRLLAFYRDTLGLTPRSVKPSFANFEWGGVRLSLGRHSRVEGANPDPERVMVNLRVDDIQAAHLRLVSAGVRFSRPPERESWGGWVATLQDPDGNTLQLLQLNDHGAADIPSRVGRR